MMEMAKKFDNLKAWGTKVRGNKVWGNRERVNPLGGGIGVALVVLAMVTADIPAETGLRHHAQQKSPEAFTIKTDGTGDASDISLHLVEVEYVGLHSGDPSDQLDQQASARRDLSGRMVLQSDDYPIENTGPIDNTSAVALPERYMF
jgi:hypothetical protein